MEIARICPMCGGLNVFSVSDDVAEKIDRYMNGIGYIQDIPLSAPEREFIKTGYCFECQDLIFGTDEEAM